MSDHHQWGDDTLPDDIEDDEMRDDPERIWLEPWDETGHRIWDDDPTTWGDAGVEYVRADLYEEARRTIESNEEEFKYQDSVRIDQWCRIADLERRLAEAEERAGLFDGLPEPTSLEAEWLSRRDVVAHLSMHVNTGWFWRVTTVAGQKSGPGTLAECLTALRRELEVDRGE